MKKLGIAIIGAGSIGAKRAAAVRKTSLGVVRAVVDTDFKRAEALAKEYICPAFSDYRQAVKLTDVQAVVIAVPNAFIFPIAVAAAKNKKHILCEKPFGVSSREARLMLAAAKKNGCLVMIGFNHRFHAAVLKARKIFEEGKIGKLLFIRVRYGHGGRLGMEKEWRSKKKICGGGELLDQGVHVIDLCRWFGGEIREVFGKAETKFWPIKVEDNAFVVMKTDKNVTCQFQVSWTNWKNIFSLEIFGSKGYLNIDGKGGSYGKEKLIFGVRPEKFGAPAIEEFEFEGDTSWENEWRNFYNALNRKGRIIGDGNDGLEANRVIEAIYKSSKLGRTVRL